MYNFGAFLVKASEYRTTFPNQIAYNHVGWTRSFSNKKDFIIYSILLRAFSTD